MSSSSTTACSRSPSPSPATPESSDSIDRIMSKEQLSAWCYSLPGSGYILDDGRFGQSPRKTEEGPTLELEDLIQEHVYEDCSPSPLEATTPESMFCAVTAPTHLNAETPGSFGLSRNMLSMTKPIPPPPLQPRKDPPVLQRVVFPPKEECSNIPIVFPNIPDGAKSRVETQIRLTVDLAHASSSSGEPLKYDKVGSWKWLRLPKGTSTKRRTRKEGKVDAAPEDSLYLTTEITCATVPHTLVTACSSCQAREAKRVARKIAARVRPARSDSEVQDDAPIIPGRGKHEDTSNIIQFNCPEVQDFSSGSAILPVRITCYCRHHREKLGFLVHFTMLDCTGRVVGTGTTKPIMITDDHKSSGLNTQKPTEYGTVLDWTVGPPNATESASPTNPKRRKARGEGVERKKRSKPYDTKRETRIKRRDSSEALNSPSELASGSAFVTRASTPLQPSTFPSPLQAAESPAFPIASYDCTPSDCPGSAASTAVASPDGSVYDSTTPLVDFFDNNYASDVAMPDCSDRESSLFASNATYGLLDIQTSMPPQPPVTDPLLIPPQPLTQPPIPYNLFTHDPPPSLLGLPPPTIHRLIPASGPTYGGVEVTVLGANFHPTLQLNCVFGGVTSTSTQRWSDNTLVCILPPSTTAGSVHVWFEGLPKDEDAPCVFTYTDDTDRALMELALQVVGLKMTGKIEDARNVAMRIVGNTGAPEPDPSISAGSTMQLSGSSVAQLLRSHAGEVREFEKLILDFLAVLDIPMERVLTSVESGISKSTASGQTLLHLAALARFPTLVRFLLTHGIDVDARDNNGCTALYLAALADSQECAQALVNAGADLEVVNAAGKSPAEVGAPGFFDFIGSDSERSVHDDHDDEGAWGDVEDESEAEDDVKRVHRRRSEHKLRRQRSWAKLPLPPPPVDFKEPPSEKKAYEAGIVNEKQAVASFTETLYRTLAQLQHPQGMIANIQNIPYLQLPNLPGIPAWGVLPQMPAVFPVLVPMPQLSALWDRRGGRRAEGDSDGDTPPPSPGQLPWLGIPTAQDWKAIWEKWLAQVNLAMRANDVNNPPPAYTPRGENSLDSAPVAGDSKENEQAKGKGKQLETSDVNADVTSAPDAAQRLAADKAATRPSVYEQATVPQEEVELYGYRPTGKPARRQQKKHDRMLILFWIPILLVGFAWAFLNAMRIAFHTARAVVTVNAVRA